MFETVKSCYLKDMIDESGLDKAVKLKWITEEQKKEIMASKIKPVTQ